MAGARGCGTNIISTTKILIESLQRVVVNKCNDHDDPLIITHTAYCTSSNTAYQQLLSY